MQQLSLWNTAQFINPHTTTCLCYPAGRRSPLRLYAIETELASRISPGAYLIATKHGGTFELVRLFKKHIEPQIGRSAPGRVQWIVQAVDEDKAQDLLDDTHQIMNGLRSHTQADPDTVGSLRENLYLQYDTSEDEINSLLNTKGGSLNA